MCEEEIDSLVRSEIQRRREQLMQNRRSDDAWFWPLELLFNGSIACWSRHIRRTITDAYATVSWAEFFLSIKRMGAWPWLQQQQGACLAAIPSTYSLQLTNYLVLQFILLQSQKAETSKSPQQLYSFNLLAERHCGKSHLSEYTYN